MRKIQTKIDVYRQNYTCLKCKQNDDIVLEITLLENGTPYLINDKFIDLNWVKSDNTFVKIDSTKINTINNVIIINLPKDCTRAIGESRFELEITDNNSKQLSTFPLSIDVIGSVIGGTEASKNLLTVIEELKEMIEVAEKQDNEEYIITTPDWGIINPKTLEYTYILPHTLDSKKLHVTAYENGKKVSIGVETIDNNHIKLTTDSNGNMNVILSSGYYGGYTSGKTETDITNIFNQLANLDCGTW